jgi:phosphoribosyl 1,2-cyclic phosphodiesterase
MAGRILVLGSGAAEMTPAFNCSCPTCREASLEPKLRRRCTCILVELDGERLLLDLGSPEAVAEAGALGVEECFLSHGHVDHLAGLNLLKWSPTKVTLHCLKETAESYYVKPLLEGAEGVVGFKEAKPGAKLDSRLHAAPIRLSHSIPTLGLIVENAVAYALDTIGLPEDSLRQIREAGVQVLLIDATYGLRKEALNHNNLAMALELARRSGAELTVLTHIAHFAGRYSELTEAVRREGGVELALDGSTFNLS